MTITLGIGSETPPPSGSRIASLRELRGWTQEELAERSGLSVRTIRNLELGWVQNPRRSSLDMLAQALGFVSEWKRPAGIVEQFQWRGPQPSHSVVVGNSVEHERLTQAVRVNRLTTLYGAGGVGKTRLALNIAAQIGHSFRQGVAVVELGDLPPERCSPEEHSAAVLQLIWRQLGVGGPTDTQDAVMASLKPENHVLLILDNAEHVPAGVTAATKVLLGSFPDMRLLITTRRRLSERMGTNHEIRPLSVEVAGSEPFCPPPAVDLVLRHVGAGTRAAAALAKDLPLVAELCRRLGGLPRYLEFAAERLRTIPIRLLLAHGPTIDLLQSEDHSLLRHQRSVTESIRWSMAMLTEQHLTLLREIASMSVTRFALEEITLERTASTTSPLTLISDLLETSLVVGGLDDRYQLAPFVADVVRLTLPKQISDSARAVA